jgi:hypothetical protein
MKFPFCGAFLRTSALVSIFLTQAKAFSAEVNAPRSDYVVSNYLKMLLDMEARVRSSGSENERNGLKQQLAGYQSYVGDFALAVETMASAFSLPQQPPSPNDAELLRKNVTLHDPVSHICSAMKTRRILIINEAHHQPNHRAFGRRLLACLRELGFRYAAFETIGEESDAINARGFVTRNTGWYSLEPQMARLINTSLDLGFRVVRYETRNNCNNCSIEDDIDAREEDQALNLQSEIFNRDSNAKAVIWVGFAHAYKYQRTADKRPRWMAARLWEKTGIEPYTVEQVSEEFSSNNWSAQYYEALAPKGLSKQSALLDVAQSLKSVPEFFWLQLTRTLDYRPALDAIVIHPRQEKSSGRWDWLETPNEERMLLTLKASDDLKLQKGLVQVFPEATFLKQRDIPLDQALFEFGKPVQIAAPQGRYVIRRWDSSGTSYTETTRDLFLRVENIISTQ